MKPKKRQKLCHNCEGDVDLDVIVCPYCAADLREIKPEEIRSFAQSASFNRKETSQSLYPSPLTEETEEPPPVPHRENKEPLEEKKKGVILPTVLFTLGVQLLLLGLLVLLFSHKGIILLRWEARFWFLYVFTSIPLLAFGYRALSKL